MLSFSQILVASLTGAFTANTVDATHIANQHDLEQHSAPLASCWGLGKEQGAWWKLVACVPSAHHQGL